MSTEHTRYCFYCEKELTAEETDRTEDGYTLCPQCYLDYLEEGAEYEAALDKAVLEAPYATKEIFCHYANRDGEVSLNINGESYDFYDCGSALYIEAEEPASEVHLKNPIVIGVIRQALLDEGFYVFCTECNDYEYTDDCCPCNV